MIPPLNSSFEQDMNICYSQPSVDILVKSKPQGKMMNLNFTIYNLAYSKNETQFTIIF